MGMFFAVIHTWVKLQIFHFLAVSMGKLHNLDDKIGFSQNKINDLKVKNKMRNTLIRIPGTKYLLNKQM